MVTPIKKKLKKAFTITELVIVIAVIAILAAVLIPTLSGVVSRANESVAMQEAQNDWNVYLYDIITDSSYTEDTYYVVHYKSGSPNYYFKVTDGQFDTDGTEYGSETGWKAYNWEITSGLVASYVDDDITTYKVAESTCTKIYSEAKAAAAAAAAAIESVSGCPASGVTYYACVVVTETSATYYFKLVADTNTNVGWASTTEITSSAYTNASKATTATIDENVSGYNTALVTTGYSVTAYAARS